MSDPAGPVIYADARCLQDPGLQFRGLGNHVACLLRGRNTHRKARGARLVGLIADDLPPLPAVHRDLFDEVSLSVNPPVPPGGAIYIDASPMTHSSDFGLRLIHHPRVLGAGLVHDFIPWDWPGYPQSPTGRREYLARLAHLKLLALFFPVSHYTARRLKELVAAPPDRIGVTGVAFRSSLRRPEVKNDGAAPGYFLIFGGGDPWKNTAAAVKAVGLLNSRRGERHRLVAVGRYDPGDRKDLLRLARESAYPDFLEFRESCGDAEMAGLYAGAMATIAPSFLEGFGLPVVEAAFCGSPVIASSCDAHRELIGDPEALFPASEPEALASRLERVLIDAEFRDRLLQEQSSMAARFREADVQDRFWNVLVEHFDALYSRPAYGLRGAKPRLAFMSPYPPQRTGIAPFTERTLEAARDLFAIDLYTDAPRPLTLHSGLRDGGPVGRRIVALGPYDAIVTVMGNSPHHLSALKFFERYGGPCILHDAHLTHIHHERLGHARFVQLASRLVGHPCTSREVEDWLHDRNLASLFVEPILERAQPLIVQTKAYRDLLWQRYGFRAEVATFPPNIFFAEEELSLPSRSEARRRLGLSDKDFVVSTFGFVTESKGAFTCVSALEILRSSGVPASLHFVGDPQGMEGSLKEFAARHGVEPHIHFTGSFVAESTFREYLLASDAAVQLRRYDFAQHSGALADCISACLPAVASAGIAAACEAPEYVERVPFETSAPAVAEALGEIYERPRGRERLLPAQRAYLETHNFTYYAKRLREILGFS